MGGQGLQRSPSAGKESKWRPLELCRWPRRGRLPAKGKEYPALGFKKLQDRAPKALAEQPLAQLISVPGNQGVSPAEQSKRNAACSSSRAPKCVKRCCDSRGRPTHRGCSRVRQSLLASILYTAPSLTALTETTGVYVRRLEAACQLLHRKLQPSSVAAAQTTPSCLSTHDAPSAAPPTPSTAGNTAAVELCTLLLTDQEVLDVVLALHDIRTAQYSELLPWTRHRHTLHPSLSSEPLDQQLRHSQRSVPGSQLSQFIGRLEHATRMEDDPLLYVWDSMHRAMQLVLAALQSLPIRPHPQHPDPAATTHTSTTTQLPPGYHRCSACLLLTLRLALRLSQFCNDQINRVDQHLARLHATLPGLLLGLNTAVSVMQAAGHPEADAHRLLLLRCIVHLGPVQIRSMSEMGWCNIKDIEEQLDVKPTTSCPDHLAHLLASSPVVTGWPGPLLAKLSPMNSNSTAGASSGLDHTSGRSSSNRVRGRGEVQVKSPGQGSKGFYTACSKDLTSVNSFAHPACVAASWTVCTVVSTGQESKQRNELQADASCLAAAALDVMAGEYYCLKYMARILSAASAPSHPGTAASGHQTAMGHSRQESKQRNELQADASCLAAAALDVMAGEYYCLKYMARILSAASAPSHPGTAASGHQTTPLSASSSPLLSVVLSVLPRSLVLVQGTVAAVRLGATVDNRFTLDKFPGCLRDSYTLLCDIWQLMVELWPDGRCPPAMLRLLVRTAAVGADGYNALVLLLDGAPDYKAETRLLSGVKPEQASSDMRIRLDECHQQGQYVEGSAACGRKKVHILPPSAQQLAPLALDLVWGMEGILQMMQQHWRMFCLVACEGVSRGVCSLTNACCTSLVLFGHVIEVLAEPAAVGPAGLAAQPASWLPCGNSLVEGWCSQLLARVCQLFYINSPALKGPLDHTRMLACRGLAGNHTFLPKVQEQALPNMSPEDERLLSCLTLVLTMLLPLDAWLAAVAYLPAAEAEMTEQASAIHDLLTRVEAEQVWSWQALAAGTPAEASLATDGNTAAAELCTLLLTDQEVLDVVLALHDIRTAQLCNLLPFTRAHLPPPVYSGAFARRLSQRQRSASGDQLHLFVEALERDTIAEGDPLLCVWDGMHRAMLLVLAALQSLPIRPHPQHPDPAASTHTSTTTQLPPGYHRCSASLLLSLSLALRLSQFCFKPHKGVDQYLARLHATLPGLLLGLSTSVTVMQAAGHPEAQGHRLLLLRCILHLGPLQSRIIVLDVRDHCQDVATYSTDRVCTSCPDHLAHLLASSPAVTGWPGSPPAKPSYEDSYSTAGASSGVGPTSGSSISSSRGWGRSKVQGSSQGQSGKGSSTGSPMDLASVNTYAHVAQALCAVLGRQEEGLIITQLWTVVVLYAGPGSWSGLQQGVSFLASTALGVMTREYSCLEYVVDILGAASAPSHLGAVAACHQTAPSSASRLPLLPVVLSVLSRCLTALQAGVASTQLCASIGTLKMPDAFPTCLKASYTLLCDALQVMVELCPDWRCRPTVLRLLVRTAAAGAHAYSALALLLDGAPHYEAETRFLSDLKRTPELKALSPELEAILSDTLECVCSGWVFLLLPLEESEQASSSQSAESNASRNQEELPHQPPSAQQLAPLALDLVWGMEGMLQVRRRVWSAEAAEVWQGARAEMMQQHWRMFPPMARVEDSSLFRICCASLDLFGHVINALAEPTAVGPAGLAALPASWLPCGNSLVEGWCSQLLDRVCQLLCINSPGLKGRPDHTRLDGCHALACSHTFLPEVQEQAPPSMSPEAERLLSCLMLVLTVALPLDTWLAGSPSLPADGAEITEQAIHDLLTRVEAEQVWSWQALAAGTPAEASLASVLQGAANKLQLPHLVAPAPQGWQPGRLTLDRGRGPPEFMRLDAGCLGLYSTSPPCVKRCCGLRGRPTLWRSNLVRYSLLANLRQAARSLAASIEAVGVYVRRLEAACLLLHRKLQPSSILAARTTSSCPSSHTAPSPSPPTPSAAGNTAAVELCTLLLTDQEVLDVVLALHDIRTAQLWNLLPWSPDRHTLYLPLPSESLDQQLRHSQRSVPGSQLSQFISRLERATRMEGDPLLYVWDRMHRIMQLVLAALQSLPIRPHPQHPDPAATTHTSTTTQLPPGYHRWSACLLLSLRLALRLSQFCNDQLNGVDQLLTRLHATLPGLLLGLSTAVSVMQAAGHPEAQAHRLLLLRCILHMGPLQLRCLVELGWYNSKDIEEQLNVKPTTSCPDHLARLLASSPAMTGWPGPLPAKPSSEHSSTAGASLGLDHTSSRSSSNSCRGRGRVKGKSSGQGGKGSSSACPKDLAVVNSFAHVVQALCAVLGRQEEGLIITQLVSMCKAEGTVAAVRLSAILGSRVTASAFPGCFQDSYSSLGMVLRLMVDLWPNGRCRPAMLRLLARTAAAGAHGYSTLVLLLDGAPYHVAETRLLSGLKRTPELKARTHKLKDVLLDTMTRVCCSWILLLVYQRDTERASSDMHISPSDSHQQGQYAEGSAACGRKVVHNWLPSAQQLAPLALDLVWGMEGMLQPASWLPCGNSLVEGWCSQLLARVCQLFYINSPDLKGPLDHARRMEECQALAFSHTYLFRVQEQASPRMSPEAERLLACLTLVLTVALPLDTWLAVSPSLPADGSKVSENTSAIHDLLTCVEPEQVWSWQALAAGTPAKASLASVLQGAASKLQLPHLVAPAPRGWQPGRLTLDMGRGPPELMMLCFPSLTVGLPKPLPIESLGLYSTAPQCVKRCCGSRGRPTIWRRNLVRSLLPATLRRAARSLTAAIEAVGVYVRRLEAACQLLHLKLKPSSTAAAQTTYSCLSSHKALPAAPPTASAAGNTAAVELCTLLLTDQEVLNVVLALHDIRTAQISKLLLWAPHRHTLYLPMPSESLDQQLRHSQRSVPGSQLSQFIARLERATRMEGDALLYVWDSMHRAMQLVLAALQSLPIRPHPQHPDPAATTHTSTTTQLPPGYHRCSACLLLSLRLALRLSQFCIDQLNGVDQLLARLHATLPGLLLGLSTAVSMMQAAGHPEAQAHRLLLLRCIVHMGSLQLRTMDWQISKDMMDQLNAQPTTSCPDHLARLLASSPAVTGWPGHPPAKLSSEHSSTAGASSGLGHTSGSSSSSNSGLGRSRVKGRSPGQGGKGSSTACPKDLAVVNSFAHVAQALCAVLGRQEEGLIIDQLISTCKAEAALWTVCTVVSTGQESWNELQADASCLATAALRVMTREYLCLKYMARILSAASAPSHTGAVASGYQTIPSNESSSPLLSVVLSVLPRSLVLLQGTVAAVRLGATLGPRVTMKAFPGCFRDSFTYLCMALGQAVELWPDGRCQPAMRRLLARAVAAGAHGYSTQALLLEGAPDCEEEARVLSCLKRTPELKARTPELEALLTDTLLKARSSALKSKLSSTLENVCSAWVILLVPHSDTEQASSNMDIRFDDSHPEGHYVEGSAACGRKKAHKLPPSAQQLAPLALDLVWGMEGMLQVRRRVWSVEASGVCLLLVLFGHVIEVLAEPAAVGPAGLAAQPASWLPCGNSLVEGWCSQLLARVCQLFYINSPALKGPPDNIRMMGCHGLDGSQKYLLRDRQQAPTSMSLEAERLLACLTLVLTVVAPLDTWLAAVACLPAAGAYASWQASAIHGLLTRVEPEKVWGWQALAAGTPAEASLASVLQGVANTLRLPHLGDPLLYVWDSMHRTMLLVLAALQSLPIRPHPQHPDPAATTHTSTTTQLPPGYHRCSACLLLSLRLALRLSQFCNGPAGNGVDQLLARLHATLPRLLLGLSTAVSVMQAAGHPEAEAHRLLLLRCILHMGTTADYDLAVVNSLAHVAQALCAVLGRQEEGLIMDQLISTCKAEGSMPALVEPGNRTVDRTPPPVRVPICQLSTTRMPTVVRTGQESLTEFRTDASCLATATLKMMAREYYCTKYMVRILDAALAPSHLGAVASGHQNTSSSASSPPLLTIVLNVLPRCLVFLRGTVAAVRLGAAHDTHYTLNAFPSCFRNSYSSLCLAIRLTVELCPDVRCRPAMLRLLARTAAAGAHGYSTLVLLLDGAPDYEAGLERTPQLKASLVHTLDCVCGVWVTLLMPHSDTEQVSSDNIRLNDSHPHGQNAKGSAACGRKKVLNQPPSAQQLAPLALDLVWGMDGMLQVRRRVLGVEVDNSSGTVSVQYRAAS
ncbi:hypothetical protein QJQ45_019582 [Haematococcus lacustris]|nr:hypothetical protein QJQ45_019582 [Haematococcus lacustris]